MSLPRSTSLIFFGLVFAILSSCLSAKDKSVHRKHEVLPIGVQLWSVRDKLSEDFEGTLTELSKMGFSGVEFAGNYGGYEKQPEKLKEFLDKLNLKVCGVHVSFKDLDESNLEKNLAFYKALGVKFVIVPWDKRAWSSDGIESLVSDLNKLVKPLHSAGMKIGFHNHDKEFKSYKGLTYWDYIATNTSEEVLLQLDIGWVNFANKDPLEYIKKYPNRTLTTHYKIRTRKGSHKSPIIGTNKYPWNELLKTNIDYGGTEWIVLEQEEYPQGMTSLEAVKLSLEGLKKVIHKAPKF